MNKQEREAHMIELMAQLTSEPVDNQYKIKGTTIEKLCAYEAGGYKGVIGWLEGEIEKLEPEEEIEHEAVIANPGTKTATQPEIVEMESLYKEAYGIMVSRNRKYGDSWKVLSLQSIANLIEMKMHRIANMTNDELDPKIVDEFVDSMNYSAMGLYKYKKEL